MGDKKIKTGTGCCGTIAFLEPIYLITSKGRRKIGEIPICANFKCRKKTGMMKVEFDAPPAFNSEAWRKMMKVHSEPPYYFQFAGEELLPEGFDAK